MHYGSTEPILTGARLMDYTPTLPREHLVDENLLRRRLLATEGELMKIIFSDEYLSFHQLSNHNLTDHSLQTLAP